MSVYYKKYYHYIVIILYLNAFDVALVFLLLKKQNKKTFYIYFINEPK